MTHRRIFRAALKVFSDRGLHGARIDTIARRARVNKQRIYAYFGSKKDLYRRVLLEAYIKVAVNERLMQLTEEDIPHMTGLIVDAIFEIHETDPTFWRLLCWENLSGGTTLRPADWARIRSKHVRHLRRLYESGQAGGVFRPDIDFSAYLIMLFSSTYFYFSNQLTMSHLLKLRLESPRVRLKIKNQLMTMMESGITRS